MRKIGVPEQSARQTVESLAAWKPVDTSLGLVQAAWYWKEQVNLSYWDALVIAAAQRAGCRWLLSEDFQEGQSIGEVTIINPFSAKSA